MARINSGTTASEVFRVFAALELCDAPPAYRTQLYVTVPIVVVILAVLLHSIWSRYKERSLWIFRIQKTHCGKTLWVCNNIYMTVAVGIIYFILSYTLAWVEVFYISHHQVWRGVTRTIQWIPLFSAAWFSMLGTFRAAPGFTSRIFPGNTQLARYLSHELDKINNILLVAGPVILTLVQGPIAVMAVIRRREALNQLHEVLAELAALPVKHRLDERQAALATQVMSSFEKAMGLEELSLLLYGVFSGAGIVGMASLCIFMIKHLRREMNRELSLVGFGLMSVVCRSQNHTQQLITHPILDAAAIEAENAAHSRFYPRIAATPRPRGVSVISSPQSKASMIGAAIMNITTTTFFVGGGSIFYTFIALFSYAQVRQGFGLPVTELCARSWTCLTIVFWLNNLMAIAFFIIVLLKTLDPVIDGISRQRTVFVREDHVSRKFDCVDRQEWHQPFIVRWFAQGKEGPSISDGGPRGQHEIRHPCSRTVSDVPCGQPSGASPPSSQCSKRIDEDAEEENDGEGYPLKLIQTGDSAPLSSVPYMDQADLLFSGAFIGEHLIATQHIEYKQETYITATPVEGTAPLEHQTSRDSTSRSKRRLHFLRPHRG